MESPVTCASDSLNQSKAVNNAGFQMVAMVVRGLLKVTLTTSGDREVWRRGRLVPLATRHYEGEHGRTMLMILRTEA